MLGIKQFIKFIVFSNIWIAFLAAGLTFNTYLLNKFSVNINICLLVFFSTFSIYNLQRIVKHYTKNNNYSKRHEWIYNNIKMLIALVTLSSITSVFLFFFELSLADFLFFIPFTIISGLYAVSIFSKQRALRDLPFLKIFLIAGTWAVTTVYLPFLEHHHQLTFTFWGQFLFTFCFIIAITIPFDIRDLHLDDKNTRTLPQVFGIQKAINLAILVLIACLIINYFMFFKSIYIIIIIITILLVRFSNKKMPELYYSGIIDGTMLLFPVLNYIFY